MATARTGSNSGDRAMNFPESDALKGTINNLKDIVSRSSSDNNECSMLLNQIESTLSAIENKTKSQSIVVIAPSVATPVTV
jgi:hypothetical protein